MLTGFVLAFGVIIAANLTLAINAMRTFPGHEVKNSYVASQSFDVERAAQQALEWSVSAQILDDKLVLTILEKGKPIAPKITNAIFGRATHMAEDQMLQFTFDGHKLYAPVMAGPGNWNLRLTALAGDGTEFRQRIPIRLSK